MLAGGEKFRFGEVKNASDDVSRKHLAGVIINRNGAVISTACGADLLFALAAEFKALAEMFKAEQNFIFDRFENVRVAAYTAYLVKYEMKLQNRVDIGIA